MKVLCSVLSEGVLKIKVSCKYCGGIHNEGVECVLKPKRKFKQRYDEIGRFRNSKAWRMKRDEIKERYLFMCVVCLQNKILNLKQIEVHHIEPLVEAFNRRLDDDNLIPLCATHHKAAEKGEITREYLFSLIKQSPPTQKGN